LRVVQTLEVPDTRDLRFAGGLMLAAAVVLPAIPGHPGLPCPLRTLTGVPCPLCGMTTSVEATVHFHLGDALAAAPAGIIVVALAIVFLIRRPERIRVPMALVYVVLAAMWIFQLHRFGFV
jgi:hypothetical protein